VESLAGRYTSRPGLSGEECYLFSDGSYIFTTWADILPETIYEKGTWSVEDRFIILKPDGSLPRDQFPKDHVYASLLLNGAADVYLMSHRWDFSYFLDHGDKRCADDTMFRVCTLRRASQPSKTAQEEERKQLMARAWRPDFFQEERAKAPRRWQEILECLPDATRPPGAFGIKEQHDSSTSVRFEGTASGWSPFAGSSGAR